MTSEEGEWLSLRPDENDASFGLDLLRWLAAQAVVVGHAASFFGPYPRLNPPAIPNMQDIAVVVFFLLSGFLIAHAIRKGMTREGYGFREYAVDRVARIYSGYLPALVFVALVDYFLLRNADYAYAFDALTFASNVVMLQDFPAPLLSHFTSFGTGRPLWTLAVEMWIYLFVGAAFFFRKGGYTVRQLALVAALSLVPAYNLFRGRGSGLFGVWLLGAGIEHVCAAGYLRRIHTGVLGLVALGGLALFGLVVRRNDLVVYTPSSYPFLAAALLALIAMALRSHLAATRPVLRRIVAYLANFSFSLYLTHYTVMVAVLLCFEGSKESAFWLAVAGSNLVALVFAHATERHHKKLGVLLRQGLARIERLFSREAPVELSGSK